MPNVIYLRKLLNRNVLRKNVEGLYYIYTRSNNDLYMYDSFRDAEFNLYDLQVPYGNINFNFKVSDKGNVDFNFNVINKGNIDFNFSFSEVSTSGIIDFSFVKVDKGNIDFNFSKEVAGKGDLIVNTKLYT